MTAAKYFQEESVITDELVEHARSMVGMEIRTEGWNTDATRDNVRHYAWGLGDDNPLFTDPEYGRKSAWGSMLAPPTFLYTISDTGIAPGLAGLQPIYTGGEWTFARPIRVGESITATAQLVDVRDVKGKAESRTPRMILQIGETNYYDTDGLLVGSHTDYNCRIMRSATGEGAYAPRAERVMTPDEHEEVGRLIRTHERRGAEPRYWEDVVVGDELPQVVKQISELTMLAYYAGCPGSPGYKACELQWKYRDLARHDADALPNQFDPSYFAAYVLPSLGHSNESVAHAIGMPGRYNNGCQRVGWAAHLITDWMGDDGVLKKLSFRMHLPEIYGDVIYVRGRVTRKDVSDGESLVDCEIEAVNHLGEVTATGSALVALPSRRSAE